MQKPLLYAMVCLTLGAVALFAQATTSLNGTIADPTGAVVPNASLSLVNADTSAERKTTADAEGRYSFAQLRPGRYRLTVRAPGFNEVIVNDVRLLVNTPATIPIVFEKIGTVATTIAVTGEAIQVNTVDASMVNAISERPITQLPFEARNVVGLLALQPGVTYLGEPDPGTAPDFRSGNVNGGKSDQANITLDGVDVNDQQNRSAFTSVLRVTLDSVQEFRTITTNANADFGRTSGAQVTLLTKSGANAFHGSVYEYLRNTKTSANDWFSNQAGVARAKLNRNVFGGSLGGPIKKDRLFFFVNYEGRKDRSETVSSARTVPTADFRQGVFSYQRQDGALGQLSPAEVRAKDPLGIGPNPAVLQLLQSYPLPNSNAAGDSLNTSGFIFNHSTPLDWNTYIAKFDFKLDRNGNHNLFWRGNLQNDKYKNGLPNFPGDPPSSVLLENSKGHALGYTAVLTPTLISNFRYGYTRQGFEATGVQTAAMSRLRDISNRYAGTRGLARIVPVHHISHDLNWNKGAHNIGFGGAIRVIRNKRRDQANSFSDALANASYLRGAGAEFVVADAEDSLPYRRQFTNLLGIMTQLTGQYNYDLTGNPLPEGSVVARTFGSEEYELYVHDTWRATRALTVSAGVRLGLFPPVYEATGYQVSTLPALSDWYEHRASLAAQGRSQAEAGDISLDLASSANGRPLYPRQTNWSPRLSLAYSPQGNSGMSRWLFGGPGKTSIRAGFGMFYELFGQSIIRLYDATALGFSTQVTNSANVRSSEAPRFTGVFQLPFSHPLFPQGPATSTFPQVYPDLFAITNSLDDKLRAPYTMNINFSIQRELPGGFMVQGAYVGRLSRRSLTKDDVAMPTNLVDPVSGMNYRQAAGLLTSMVNAGTPTASVGPIPYFENLWAPAAGGGQTATQNIYDLYSAVGGDYTTALVAMDVDCYPACSILGPNAIFDNQFGSLVALRSRGNGSYHAMQWVVRKQWSSGFQFDLNYTWAKSIDLASTPESQAQNAGGLAAQSNSTDIINSWYPQDMRAVSDYDVTHNISAFWVADLPFGRGRRFGRNVNRALNGFIGGWSLNGIFRATSGLPTGVTAGGVWPTNWQVGSNAIQTGATPRLRTTKNAPPPTASGQSGPNMFPNPGEAINAWSLPLAGDSGQRNGIRGDGVFGIDLGLAKRFPMFWEGHSLQLRGECFNVTNSVRFDPFTASTNILNAARFGQYVSTLTRPRVFQFGLRYEF
jgi:hypothetical protein